MALKCIRGRAGEVNRGIVAKAVELAPSLLIDAANSANIHQFPDCHGFYVVQAESLYRLVPTLQQVPRLARRIPTKNVLITTFSRLFGYDNKAEDTDIFEYSWELIARLSEDYDFHVGIEQGTIHEQLAMLHKAEVNEVGHTVWSQRIVSDMILEELSRFGKSLRKEDLPAYSQLIKEPLKYLGSISYASSANTWAFLLFAALLEQQKKIDKINEQLVSGCVQG